MISELLRRAAAKCGKERRVLDFAQAFMRQRMTRFRKLVRSMEEEETPPKWITDEPFEHLQGFRALDGGNAEETMLDDAWSCMQAGIVNVLCQGGRKKGLWKPIIADFSVTDAEGKVKAGHRRITKEGEEIPAVCLMFGDVLKVLKQDLKDVRKLEEYPADAETDCRLEDIRRREAEEAQ